MTTMIQVLGYGFWGWEGGFKGLSISFMLIVALNNVLFSTNSWYSENEEKTFGL